MAYGQKEPSCEPLKHNLQISMKHKEKTGANG